MMPSAARKHSTSHVLYSLTNGHTRARMLVLVVVAAVNAVLASQWPIALSETCNKIANSDTTAGFAALLFAVFFLGSELLAQVRRVVVDCLVARNEQNIRNLAIRKLLRLPISFYGCTLSGDLSARVNQSVSGFGKLLRLFANDIFPALLTCVMVLIKVIENAPLSLAAIMILYLFLSVTASVFQITSQNGVREHILHLRTSLDGKIVQSLQNLELIRGLNADEYESKRLAPSVSHIAETEVLHFRTMGRFDFVKKLLQVATFSSLLFACWHFVQKNAMSGASVLTAALLFQQLLAPVESAYRCMDEACSASVKAKSLAEIFALAEDSHFNNADTSASSGCILSVTACHIQEPKGEHTISVPPDFSLCNGDIASLCGAAGGGKTSVLRAIKGYFPYSGSIQICGTEVDRLSCKALAEAVLYVPQVGLFFHGTIRENLLYGITEVGNVTDETLCNALRKAQLYEQLSQLSNGNVLAYNVRENAENLSAGQRQRLAIARVFLHHFRLLIMDEATANLDLTTMHRVLDSVEHYVAAQGGAVLYISHEPDVIGRCKQVIEIQPRHVVSINSVA